MNYSLLKNYEMPRYSDAMHEYINVHQEYGLPLDIDSPLKLSKNHEINNLIKNHLTYLSSFYDNPPLNKVKVCLEVIENNCLNAFASKLNTDHRETFLLGLNSGLIEEYSAHFFDSNFIVEITKDLKLLTQLPILFLKEAALTFAITCIAFHELGHIFRGHLNYINDHLSANSISEATLSASVLNVANDDELLHMFECDADAFAGGLLSAELTSRWKKGLASNLITEGSNNLLDELVILFGAVIYYVFCLFDQKETVHDGRYPVPSVRTSIVLSHMCALIHKGVPNKKQIPNDKNLLSLIVHSCAISEAYVKRSSMVQTTKALKSEVERWSKKYSENLPKLEKTLAPYAPVPRF